MENKKIAIVHDFLTKLGGAEKVLHALHKMYPDAPIYTLLYDKKVTKGQFEAPDYKIITSSLQKYPKLIRKPKFLFPKFPKAVEKFDFSKYDIVISSSNSYAHGIITKPETFHVCYCYSPTRYLWDWYHEYLKENNIGLGLKGLFIRYLLYNVRVWDKNAAERANSWIAISKHVQKRIAKYYRKDSTVIYSPVDVSKIPFNKENIGDHYIIVSRLEPYKRIDYVVETFNKNGKPLIIIGEGSESEKLKKMAKSNIKFLGWQPDESVYKYIGSAKAFIFPGEEDFGLTPIETMATGRPVIAFNKGGVAETVIDTKTGILYNEQSAKELNKVIEKLENSSFVKEDCRKRSEEFSIEKFSSDLKSHIKKEYEKFRSKI